MIQLIPLTLEQKESLSNSKIKQDWNFGFHIDDNGNFFIDPWQIEQSEDETIKHLLEIALVDWTIPVPVQSTTGSL
jgi:hypothetical protein